MKNFKVYKFTIGILCIIAFTAINFNLNMKHKRTSLLEHIEQFGDRGTLRIPLPSRVEELLPEGDILTDELVFSIKKNINDVVSDLTKRLEKKELNWRLFRIYLIDIDYDIFKLRKQIRKGKKKPYLIDEVVKHLIEQLKNNKELFTDDFFGSAPTEAFTEFLGLTGVEAALSGLLELMEQEYKSKLMKNEEIYIAFLKAIGIFFDKTDSKPSDTLLRKTNKALDAAMDARSYGHNEAYRIRACAQDAHSEMSRKIKKIERKVQKTFRKNKKGKLSKKALEKL